MPYTIRIRRDNYTNLSTVTLGVGEIAYDTTNKQLRIGDGSTVFSSLTAIGGGAGGLTSVGLIMPNIFTVSGSPLTANGSITTTLATQTANRVFAGPTTGAAAAPTFRSLVADDIPSLTAIYQPVDATLTALAGLTITTDTLIYGTGTDTFGTGTITTFGRSLVDDADAATARTTLGFSTVNGVATSPQAETTVKYVRAAQASLTKGMVVYVSGSNGDNLNVSKAQADAESTSSKTIGLLLQDLSAIGDLGYAITEGLITGLDTNGLTPGAAVWLSPSTAGGWTTTKPSAPNHLVFLGWIVKDNASTGSIYVKVNNGQEIDELHDVQISSSANNDILQYDNTVSPPVWKNRTLANAGIAASNHTHGLTTNGDILYHDGTGLARLPRGTDGQVLKSTTTTIAWGTDNTGSGSGTPGGLDTHVQFNDGGSTFGGDSGLTYNKTTDTLTITGDLNVNGGELESSASTFNLLAVPSTVNLGAVATTVNIGNADNEINGGAATVKLLGGTLVGSLAEQNIFNTVATTGNILGAATSITMGATTGTATLRNATVTLSNATTLNINGASPTLASSSTGTLSLFNTNLLTVNAFGAATSLSIANTATVNQTINLASSTTSGTSSKTLNIGSNGASGSSTSINIGTGSSGTVSVTLGSASGTNTINGSSTTLANRGELRFAETSGGNYVGFKADDTIDSNLIWTLPKVDGTANQVLQTNGSGVLSWATAGTGSGTKTYAVFTPLDNQPPAANYATLDTVNTTSPIAVLDFNDGTDEYAIFVGIMPEASTFTSGLKIILFWTGDTTSTNSVVWSAEIENDEGYDIDTDGWDTNTVSTTTAHNGVAGQINKTTITLGSGDVDGIAAGQPYRLRVFRDANNGSDNYVGDAMLMAVEVRNGA